MSILGTSGPVVVAVCFYRDIGVLWPETRARLLLVGKL